MSETKDRRRQRNAEAGAVGKLGRDRQSAMVKALQNIERASDTSAEISRDTFPSGMVAGHTPERTTVYPTKGQRWVDPEVCRPWRWADRPASEAPHVDELAQSLDRDGQVAPAIVRPVRDPEQPTIRYEIIAGYVRWKAALQARRQLLVDIRPVLSDREAFSIMVVENDLRRGLSDYTRAKRYQRALDKNLFASKGELADAVGIGNAQLSKYLGFAKLPNPVVAVCRDITALPLTTGYILASLCGKGFQEQVIALLPRIEAGDIAGRQLEELAVDPSQLGRFLPTAPVSEAAEATPSGKPESRSFVSSSGNPLFTVNISQRRAFISFVGPFRTLLQDEEFLNRLKAMIEAEDHPTG
ncbi:MAG TPA: ParB/RepB/Spo0J family partition protein [Candidatus Competibacteraceae bacterium]|jgi:ParB/RepB/Spo0J family partition protein|nr:ParB/RepB/Spo0J family partition protein [Candidatus Competibacteraceae bacterium]MCP5451950.1 ParB/RepB/Spo0J family partition protein [Gammaproteobacteria bacterium]HRY15605.1 ParB/RepB/Spo0J family partition protein [Candidatus Competibacteraceae bacterium]